MDSEPPQADSIASQATPEEQIDLSAGDSAKRKAEQPNGTQTRSKRNRYISIAWYAAFEPIASSLAALAKYILVMSVSVGKLNATARCRVSAVDT